MDISQFNNLVFPKEVLQIVSVEIMRTILGDGYDKILSVKGKEFFVPRELLLRDRTATVKLMWASGYYYASEIGRLFGISREAQSKNVKRIEQQENRKIVRLRWMILREVTGGPINGYTQNYIRQGKIDCRHVLNRKLINPLGYDDLIVEHSQMLGNKVCPVCGEKAKHTYCGEKCRKIAGHNRNGHKNPQRLTWKTCPNWAKPIFKLSHGNRRYKDHDFVPYDEAAEIIGVTFASIFYWIKRGIFTARSLRFPDKMGIMRARMAIPREQIELFKRLNPYIRRHTPPVS